MTRAEIRAYQRERRIEVLREAAEGIGVSIAEMKLAQWLLERRWTVFTNDEVWPVCIYGYDGVVRGLAEAEYIRKHRTIEGMWVVCADSPNAEHSIVWDTYYSGHRPYRGGSLTTPTVY